MEQAEREMVDRADRPTCLLCGERLGVYEPVVVVGNGMHRRTSLVREPGLSEDTSVALAHPHGVDELKARRGGVAVVPPARPRAVGRSAPRAYASRMASGPTTRSHAEILRVLHRAGYPDEFIRQVLDELPEPADLERDRHIFARHGLSTQAIMNRLGGSP
jgi:hypothetical protein